MRNHQQILSALSTISLYHSSLGTLEQPGEANIIPKIGSWTSRHSQPPTRKRAYFNYPSTDGDFDHLIPGRLAGVVIDPKVAAVNDVK